MKPFKIFLLLLVAICLFSKSALSSDQDDGTPDEKSEYYTMDNVVVTAPGEGKHLSDISNSISVITREDIDASGAATAADLLKLSAGIDVWSPQGEFGAATQVRLRGFSNSRATVFLKDGVPISRIACGGTDLNEIPIDTIERIEIIRGGNASLYDTSAMGGVINIITRKGEDKLKSSLKASFGTYRTRKADAMIAGKVTDKTEIQINANHFDSDGYFAWADSWINERVESMNQNLTSWNNPEEGWSVADNYLSSLEKQTREMNSVSAGLTYRFNNDTSIRGACSYWENDNDIGYRYGYINKERSRASLEFQKNGDLEITTNLFILSEETKFSNPVLPSPDMDEEQGRQTWITQGDKNDVPLNDMGGNAAVSYTLGRHHLLTAGTEQRVGDLENELYDGLTGERLKLSQAKQYKAGYVIQDAITTGNLITSVSLRYDTVRTYDIFYEDRFSYTPFEYDTLTDHQLNPRIGFIYTAGDSTILRASWARTSTFPPLMYLLGDYECPPGREIIGNPHLETEHNYGYEAGIEQGIGKNATVRATGFYNDIRNWMQEVTAADPAYSAISVRWENIEKARNYGLELEMEWYVSDSLKLFANYSYIDTKIIEFNDKHHNYDNKELEGNEFPVQPTHKFNSGLLWKAPYRVTVNLTQRYVGERYWDIENSIKLDDYMTFDIKVSKTVNKYINVFCEINDINDRAWQDSPMHVTPGRMVYGGVRFQY